MNILIIFLKILKEILILLNVKKKIRMEKDVALKKINYLLTPLYIRNSLIFKNKKTIFNNCSYYNIESNGYPRCHFIM